MERAMERVARDDQRAGVDIGVVREDADHAVRPTRWRPRGRRGSNAYRVPQLSQNDSTWVAVVIWFRTPPIDRSARYARSVRAHIGASVPVGDCEGPVRSVVRGSFGTLW